MGTQCSRPLRLVLFLGFATAEPELQWLLTSHQHGTIHRNVGGFGSRDSAGQRHQSGAERLFAKLVSA
eukprot:symbB.v1.2.031689.t1/scaffold3705.1/size51681/1